MSVNFIQTQGIPPRAAAPAEKKQETNSALHQSNPQTAGEPPRTSDPSAGSVPSADDSAELLRRCLAQMSGRFANVSVSIANFKETYLPHYAGSAGPGAHLMVSSDFLKFMGTDEAAFQRGSAILESVLSQLSSAQKSALPETGLGAYIAEDSVAFWSASSFSEASAENKDKEKIPTMWEKEAENYDQLFKLMKEAKENAEKQKEAFKLKSNSNLYQARVEAMSRLARATTALHVRDAMATARRSICSFKLSLSLGPEKDRPKLRSAIADLEKVIARGNKKIRDLDDEAALRRKQKQAEEEQLRRKAEQLRHQLNQQQAKRRARENAQISEGRPWYYYQDKPDHRLRGYEQYQFQYTPPVLPVAPAPAGATASPSPATALPAVFVAPAIEISAFSGPIASRGL